MSEATSAADAVGVCEESPGSQTRDPLQIQSSSIAFVSLALLQERAQAASASNCAESQELPSVTTQGANLDEHRSAEDPLLPTAPLKEETHTEEGLADNPTDPLLPTAPLKEETQTEEILADNPTDIPQQTAVIKQEELDGEDVATFFPALDLPLSQHRAAIKQEELDGEDVAAFFPDIRINPNSEVYVGNPSAEPEVNHCSTLPVVKTELSDTPTEDFSVAQSVLKDLLDEALFDTPGEHTAASRATDENSNRMDCAGSVGSLIMQEAQRVRDIVASVNTLVDASAQKKALTVGQLLLTNALDSGIASRGGAGPGHTTSVIPRSARAPPVSDDELLLAGRSRTQEKSPTLRGAATQGESTTSTSGSGAVKNTHERIAEPSVVETALQHNLDYNKGNWSSEELRLLHEGIRWYGSSETSSDMITWRYLRGRKEQKDVTEKLTELRKLGKRSREARQQMEREQWTAVPRKHPKKDYNDWNSLTTKMLLKKKSTQEFTESLFALCSVKNGLRQVSLKKNLPEVLTMTDDPTCNKCCGKKMSVSWPKIYKWLGDVAGNVKEPDELNPLESAILLKILEDMDDEAMLLPEERRRELQGQFAMLVEEDFRNFEAEGSVTAEKAAYEVLDPLRSRDPNEEEAETEANVTDVNDTSAMVDNGHTAGAEETDYSVTS